jgi:hypothetical protein
MANVYVVQESKTKNILPAEKYGKLVMLLPDYNLNFMPNVEKLRKQLATFSDEDYLLLIGDPSGIGIICAIVSDINNGKFKVLKWDRQENKYYVLEVDIEKEDEDTRYNK